MYFAENKRRPKSLSLKESSAKNNSISIKKRKAENRQGRFSQSGLFQCMPVAKSGKTHVIYLPGVMKAHTILHARFHTRTSSPLLQPVKDFEK